MTTTARAERWRALDPPELLPTLRQLDNLVPFFSKQDLAILRAVVTSLRDEVARPMVRAQNVEAASEFFLGNLPTVTEILSALAQLVGARINGTRGWTRSQLDALERQVREPPLPWLGRVHQETLAVALERVHWSGALAQEALAAVAKAPNAEALFPTLLSHPSFARFASGCVTSDGLALVCLSAVFDDADVPQQRPLVATLRGIIALAWQAAWERAQCCAEWLHAVSTSSEGAARCLPESVREEVATFTDPARRFRMLSDEWNHATAHLADSVRAQEHPAWKAVVIMGKVAVPYMLAELGDPERRSWSAALRVITGESPTITPQDRGDPAKLAEAWRALGGERGWLEEQRDAEPNA